MESHRNNYKGGSPRLYGYDYTSEGYYFITICTKNRINYFGSIKKGTISLSDEGKIVNEEWHKTEKIRLDQKITLDEFCIMPNHIHGIIKIGDPALPTKDNRIPFPNFKINQFGPKLKISHRSFGVSKAHALKESMKKLILHSLGSEGFMIISFAI